MSTTNSILMETKYPTYSAYQFSTLDFNTVSMIVECNNVIPSGYHYATRMEIVITDSRPF